MKLNKRLGPVRKIGMVRNLPKTGQGDFLSSKSDSKPTYLNSNPLTPLSRRGLEVQELDPVQEVPTEHFEDSD